MNRRLIPLICILFFLTFFTSCIDFQVKDIRNIKLNKEKRNVARDTLDLYLDLWQDGQYDSMYDLLSSSSQQKIDREQFVERYTNIFSAIALNDMDIDVDTGQENMDNIDDGKDGDNIEEESMEREFLVSITFNTDTVPTFTQEYTIPTVKEGEHWKVDWSPSLIFPNMDSDDVVNIERIETKRGQILDREGQLLADTSNVYTVGAVPKAIPNRETFAKDLSAIIGISEQYILAQLNQKWVTDDSFVPLKSYPLSISQEFKDKVLSVKGVMLSSQHKSARQYTRGAQLAHVIGYVQKINDELLKKLADKGYSQEDVIGRQGIEAAMEETLRGQNGYKICIKDRDGNEKETIGQYDGEDGYDLVLTVDTRLQDICYRAMDGHRGSVVAINPKTGEILSMVSTPSFDPNMFSFGISHEEWDTIRNDESHPLINRSVKAYIPGSTFKPFTAAMGLEEGVITPDTVVKEARNKEWFPSSDWGKTPIRRVDHPDGDVDLRNALVWSDNIYFAWTALKLGGDRLEQYGTRYGFKDDLPFELSIDKGQIKNDSTNWSDQLIADTGYGQGEVLISPIQLTTMYTALLNNGNILSPQLTKEIRTGSGEIIKSFKTNIWKDSAMKEETANTLLPYLIDVVEDNTGTAHSLQIPNLKLGAKTGTAQLGSEKEEELAWLVAFTVDEESPLLLTVCLEVSAGQGKEKFDIAKSIFKEYYGR